MKFKIFTIHSLSDIVLKTCLILIAVIIVGVACTDEKPKISYNYTKSLEPHEVIVKGAEVLQPTGFDVLNSGLLIIESRLDSNKFKIFDLDNYQLMTSFGKGGNGPDEFSQIIQPFVSTTRKDRVQIFDWSNKRIDRYNIGYEMNQLTYSKSGEFTLPPQLMLSQKSLFINDTTIISSGGLTNGLISFTNTNNDSSEYFNPLNYDLDKLEVREKGYLFESDIAVNFKKKLIAIAPRFIPVLYITNFEGEQITSHTLMDTEDFDLNKFDDIVNKKGVFYGVSVSDDYIYAAYVGKTLTEMDAIIDNNDYNDINFTKLYMFNWEGEFLKSYKLLGGSYRSFSIDETNNRIYSLDLLSLDIVYFEM